MSDGRTSIALAVSSIRQAPFATIRRTVRQWVRDLSQTTGRNSPTVVVGVANNWREWDRDRASLTFYGIDASVPLIEVIRIDWIDHAVVTAWRRTFAAASRRKEVVDPASLWRDFFAREHSVAIPMMSTSEVPWVTGRTFFFGEVHVKQILVMLEFHTQAASCTLVS